MAELLEHSSWGEPDQIFDQLAGRWQIERRVDNGAALTGIAIFKPAANNQLRYCEEGRLRLPNGDEFDSERKYIYSKLLGGFAVFFNETPLRLFHELHFQADERLDGSFVVRHQVNGPKKSYLMITQYRRLAGA
jgi:Family of unknown function (DUF6314)